MTEKELQGFTGSKTRLIDRLITELERSVEDSQRSLLTKLVNKFANRLDIENGQIVNSVRNKRLLSQVDSVFNSFASLEGLGMLNAVVSGVDKIIESNQTYFEASAGNQLKEMTAGVRTQMNEWLGIKKGGNLKANGYLEKLIKDPTIRNSVKDLAIKSIVSGEGMATAQKNLAELIVGNKDRSGALEKYYRNFVYDTYSVSDRLVGLEYADGLGYNFAVYEGGTIKTSREFCIKRNGKVFSREEIKKFNPRVARPPSYNPFTDLGGYRCRHHLNWIDDETAQYLRAKEEGVTLTDNQIKEAIDKEATTEDILKNKNGKWDRDRQKMHDQIIEDYLQGEKVDADSVYMLGGAPANGKSSVVDSGKLPHPKGALIIDPDKIKGMIPEYKRMIESGNPDLVKAAANFVHEESSYLGKAIQEKAMRGNYGTIIDGVNDGSFEKVAKKIKKIREQSGGKPIRADYVSLDSDLSIKLAKIRSAKTGREVPLDYVSDMNREVSKLVPDLIENDTFDELYLWDTNVQGEPRLILTHINGKTTISDRKLYEDFLKKGR